jgi:DNA invertase Pin-like site-specific DNA recombinase
LLSKGVRVHVLNMGLMDNSPTGKLIVNVMFAFAEFERDMIVQRTRVGKDIARLSPGYKEGRPRVVVDNGDFQKILEKQKGGFISVKDACELLSISRSTWYNLVREVLA